MVQRENTIVNALENLTKGVQIGVLFNDVRVEGLKQKCREGRFHIDNPDFHYTSALEKELKGHLYHFAKDEGICASAAYVAGSAYDLVLRLPTPRFAHGYIAEAQKEFSDYSFVYTIDPKENPMKNCIVKLSL